MSVRTVSHCLQQQQRGLNSIWAPPTHRSPSLPAASSIALHHHTHIHMPYSPVNFHVYMVTTSSNYFYQCINSFRSSQWTIQKHSVLVLHLQASSFPSGGSSTLQPCISPGHLTVYSFMRWKTYKPGSLLVKHKGKEKYIHIYSCLHQPLWVIATEEMCWVMQTQTSFPRMQSDLRLLPNPASWSK